MVVPELEERGNGELLLNGYRASVTQNENVPQVCCTTMCI